MESKHKRAGCALSVRVSDLWAGLRHGVGFAPALKDVVDLFRQDS
ncbi:MAG: hypothetical protein ABFD97_11020 [Syntrophobacter sp.]